jgi:hypothetical protein
MPLASITCQAEVYDKKQPLEAELVGRVRMLTSGPMPGQADVLECPTEPRLVP